MRSPAGWLYPYSGGYFNYEYSMVRFLEREGYDVTYLSNLDVHQNPHALDRGKAFLSVGHDEYWSPAMRNQIEGARDRGMHIAIFSSDTCDGVLRFKPDDCTRSPSTPSTRPPTIAAQRMERTRRSTCRRRRTKTRTTR